MNQRTQAVLLWMQKKLPHGISTTASYNDKPDGASMHNLRALERMGLATEVVRGIWYLTETGKNWRE